MHNIRTYGGESPPRHSAEVSRRPPNIPGKGFHTQSFSSTASTRHAEFRERHYWRRVFKTEYRIRYTQCRTLGLTPALPQLRTLLEGPPEALHYKSKHHEKPKYSRFICQSREVNWQNGKTQKSTTLLSVIIFESYHYFAALTTSWLRLGQVRFCCCCSVQGGESRQILTVPKTDVPGAIPSHYRRM